MSEFSNTENSQGEGAQMPKEQGIHKVSVEESIDELFALDSRVAEGSPHLLPLETPKELLDFLTKEHQSDTYIFNDEKGLAGYVSVIDIPGENSLEVLNIGVDPQFQGRGYGKKMMLFAEEIARKSDRQKMKLVTNVKNVPAVKFYKGLGYSVTKEAENYYGDGETRYILEKSLEV